MVYKLNKLTQEYSELEVRYEDIQCDIQNLMDEQNSIESEMNYVERDIQKYRDLIEEKEIKETLDAIDFVGAGDSFAKNFAIASCFAYKGIYLGEDSGLRRVKIGHDQLMACDGHIGIAIRDVNIPDKIRNTFVKREICDKHELHIESENEINWNLDLYEFLKCAKDGAKHRIKMTKDSFNEVFAPVEQKTDSYDATVISCSGTRIGIQNSFLDLGLRCMGDEEFEVYIQDPISAVVFENSKVSLLILPIRMKS